MIYEPGPESLSVVASVIAVMVGVALLFWPARLMPHQIDQMGNGRAVAVGVLAGGYARAWDGRLFFWLGTGTRGWSSYRQRH